MLNAVFGVVPAHIGSVQISSGSISKFKAFGDTQSYCYGAILDGATSHSSSSIWRLCSAPRLGDGSLAVDASKAVFVVVTAPADLVEWAFSSFRWYGVRATSCLSLSVTSPDQLTGISYNTLGGGVWTLSTHRETISVVSELLIGGVANRDP
jgi:hypothetical protein